MELNTEDRLEILDLYGRCAPLFDAGEPDRWAALFAHQGGSFTRSLGSRAPALQLRGTVEIREYLQKRHKEAYEKRDIRHVVSNIAIEATENGASGIAYVIAMGVGDQQPPQMVATGRYSDVLIKEGLGWRFQSRTYLPDA